MGGFPITTRIYSVFAVIPIEQDAIKIVWFEPLDTQHDRDGSGSVATVYSYQVTDFHIIVIDSMTPKATIIIGNIIAIMISVTAIFSLSFTDYLTVASNKPNSLTLNKSFQCSAM